MRRAALLNSVKIINDKTKDEIQENTTNNSTNNTDNTDPIASIPSVVKTTLDNSHILKTKERETQSINYETNMLEGNTLEPNSCARFSITTNIIDPIIHAGFEILTDARIIHNAHIESIVENTVNIIVNNLTDNIMNFAINYLTIHKL